MLYDMPPAKEYDMNVLFNIHKIIFEDIYEWAGTIRKGEFLTKGGSIFCRGSLLLENADIIFGNINKENNLKGLEKNKYIERMAYYMGEINALHPFREGNGRTSREFFRELSLNAGYELDFSKTKKEELLEADVMAFNGEYNKLVKILENAVVRH
jgi:cell filamentation protein